MSLPTSLSRLLSKHPLLIASTSAGILLIAIPSIRLVRLHQQLDKVITNFYSLGPYAKDVARSSPHPRLPESVASNPENYRIFYDVATKSVPRSLLPGYDYEEMLTLYLRRNMIAFSRMPQAYLLWLTASKEDRASFTKEYLSKLDFREGDLVSGFYRVLSRDGGLCAFSMARGLVEGRLVVSIEDETSKLDVETGVWMALPQIEAKGEMSEREMTMFKIETFMWVLKDEKTVMPMERSLPRWMHETGAWWMMDSGTKWLCRMKEGG